MFFNMQLVYLKYTKSISSLCYVPTWYFTLPVITCITLLCNCLIVFKAPTRGVHPVARWSHAAQDGYECSPT